MSLFQDPSLLVVIVPWILRLILDTHTALEDAGLVLAIFFWRDEQIRVNWLSRHSSALSSIILTGFLSLCLFRWRHGHSSPVVGRYAGQEEGKNEQSESMKLLLFPCRTSHTRLLPQKHSFSYSYLYIGVPIRGCRASASRISVEYDISCLSESAWNRGWFNIRAEDYLQHGKSHLGLKEKLYAYLQSQQIPHEDYPYAYLITAPRFLGYSFNPVSFWYLYSEQMELKAMILEVSNTFDERRMYFMDSKDTQNSGALAGGQDAEEAADFEGFRHSWPKDFHVSPFNSRKGSYSLTSADPFFQRPTGSGHVRNTIVLSSSEGHPKLSARVFSTGDPIEPDSLSTARFLFFIFRWWWVGLVTYPRILREAFKLYFKTKLHVWHRPEVLRSSLGRTATGEEVVLEKLFRLFLARQVYEVNVAAKLRYIPPTRSALQEESFQSKKLRLGISEVHNIDLHVLTPAFYSNFVRYARNSEALDKEFLSVPEDEKTLYVSDPHILALIFEDRDAHAEQKQPRAHLSWSVIRRLRGVSATSDLPVIQRATSSTAVEKPSLSPLDQFVLQTCGADEQRRYRKAVLLLLVSNLVTFGYPAIIRLADWLLRGLLSYEAANVLAKYCRGLYNSNTLSLSPLVLAFISFNSVHYWALGKRLI